MSKHELIAKAQEGIKNIQVILDDMSKHRGDYNEKDLGWRCIDMVIFQNKVISILMNAIEVIAGEAEPMPDEEEVQKVDEKDSEPPKTEEGETREDEEDEEDEETDEKKDEGKSDKSGKPGKSGTNRR